ncbi:hypothetical protein IWW39_001647 [Coemansia spiralis]|uniref:Uncharacterized protein n=1 Tax=Coemansia spiralis TaxID=417178 RepID=A0A9W8GLZ0_9FUNG|nr:hypothetical protein IWW39_001647 [Coemansia spiralis]
MAARNVASILESSPALLAKGARAADAMAAFGPPGYMGSSLDSLLPLGSAAVPMPGIALGKPTQHPVHVASDAGEMSILPIAENEPQSQYYVAYGTDENKVLWLQVKVDANGNETLEGHGWKDIPT